jgi:hypothetical protein
MESVPVKLSWQGFFWVTFAEAATDTAGLTARRAGARLGEAGDERFLGGVSRAC